MIHVNVYVCFIMWFSATFRSFLQFTVTSHWPHGVKLSEEQLTVPKSVSSESMQVPAPEVRTYNFKCETYRNLVYIRTYIHTSHG